MFIKLSKKVWQWKFILLTCFLVGVLFTGCAPWIRRPVTSPEEAFRVVNIADLALEKDERTVESFLEALEKSIEYYQKVSPEKLYQFGSYKATARELQNAYLALQAYCQKHPQWKSISGYIRKHFIGLQANGLKRDGNVLFTGYYEPRVRGSLKKTSEFCYPLYKLPSDLVYVDLEAFGPEYPKKRLVGRVSSRNVRPFYTRREIDFEHKLMNCGCELVWLSDIVDTFFIHIQGSAEIVLRDGSTLNVNYASSNGHPYRSIGALLINEGKISRDEMSMNAIYEYLHRHPDEMEGILSYNPSYVFFRKVKKGPMGSLGVVLTPRRSIATDPYFFPQGAMAFIETRRTVKGISGNVRGEKLLDRFVFNQDCGGAIRGPGRVDYYWGKGKTAGEIAGSFKPWGKLFFFFPRDLL